MILRYPFPDGYPAGRRGNAVNGEGHRGAAARRAAVLKVNQLEASWDEVFGPTPPKGKRLDARRRKLAAVDPIMRLVHQHFEAGRGLSKKLFNEIGAEVGFSGTIVEEIYYARFEELRQGIRDSVMSPEAKRDLETELISSRGKRGYDRAREREKERERQEAEERAIADRKLLIQHIRESPKLTPGQKRYILARLCTGKT
jgi:hypothetical protein